jgi:hypothetical protein
MNNFVKLVSCVWCLLFASLSICAADSSAVITKEEVPEPVIAVFEKAYPGAANTKYTRKDYSGNAHYEIQFKDGEASREITYKADGGIYKSIEVYKDLSTLPEAVRDAINRDYPEAKFTRILKVDRNGTVEYMVSTRETKGITYDTSGNLKTSKQ